MLKLILFMIFSAVANEPQDQATQLNGRWELKIGEEAVECWAKSAPEKKIKFGNTNKWTLQFVNGKATETRIATNCNITLTYDVKYDGKNLKSFNGSGTSSNQGACDENIVFGPFPRRTLFWTFTPGIKLSERTIPLTLEGNQFLLDAKPLTREGEACHYRFVRKK